MDTQHPGHERQVMIGLEIHGYLRLPNGSKLFCECSVDPSAPANTTICPICTSQPGSKPMLPNKEAIGTIIAIARLLSCTVNQHMLFQRKHYSWPDLPSGYQRTISGSYGLPSAEHGSFFGIRIKEIHLEEDPARWDPDTGEVDYNRSGYPLMELVTEPDFESAEQVGEWLHHLLAALGYLDAIRDELGIKCDVNVSRAPDFIRTEVKNVHSIRGIQDAIAYELHRQQHEPARQQTRGFDAVSKQTVFMRSKEDADDYRFIPEPDLPVVDIDPAWIREIEGRLPESPERKLARYRSWGVSEVDARVIASDRTIATLFEAVTPATDAVWASRWLRRDVAAIAEEDPSGLARLDEYRDQVIALLTLAHTKRITDITCKELLKRLSTEFVDVDAHIRTHNLSLVQDHDAIDSAIEAALAQAPQVVSEIKTGKEKAINFLVGKVMAHTRGTARPDLVKERLLAKICALPEVR